MKRSVSIALLILAFALGAWAQIPASQLEGSITLNPLTATTLNAPKDFKYLVVYLTLEKCYECGYVQAVYCSGSGDCGMPLKSVQHLEPFATRDEALKFLNGTHLAWTSVKLLQVHELKLDVATTTTEVPQPPKVVESTKYSVRKLP